MSNPRPSLLGVVLYDINIPDSTWIPNEHVILSEVVCHESCRLADSEKASCAFIFVSTLLLGREIAHNISKLNSRVRSSSKYCSVAWLYYTLGEKADTLLASRQVSVNLVPELLGATPEGKLTCTRFSFPALHMLRVHEDMTREFELELLPISFFCLVCTSAEWNRMRVCEGLRGSFAEQTATIHSGLMSRPWGL